MNEMAMGLGLFVAGVVVVFLAWPWWARRTVTHAHATLEGGSLAERREAILTTLRDLDFDRTVGKVADEDYWPLRRSLLVEAAGVMTEWDEQAHSGSEMRALAGDERSCPACERFNRPGGLFCANCGLDLSAAQAECCRCGRMAERGDLFCRDCGTEMIPSPGDPRLVAALEVRA